MGGSDDHVAMLENCFPPNSFPRTLFSSMMSDEFGSRSVVGFNSETPLGPPFPGPGKNGQPSNLDQGCPSQPGVGFRKNDASDSNMLPEPKPSMKGGLAERMAARAGFSAPPRLNTEAIRPHELYTKADVGSPYLTIPPGLSPTTLLESPVFLSNSMVQPSPTTGKFQFGPSRNNQDINLMADNHDMGKDNTFDGPNASSFAFKPIAESNLFTRFDTATKSFPTDDVAVHSGRQSTDPLRSQQGNSSLLFHQSNFSLSDQSHCLHLPNNSPLSDEHLEDIDGRMGEEPTSGGSSGEDGYIWRKYGQKHVKGSDYPRSYYKCTHQNCPVKKKVEQSREGHITEIIYKGAHNHAKPGAGCRSGLGLTNAFENMQSGLKQCGPDPNGDPVWSAIERTDFVGVPKWKPDNLERTSSLQLGGEYHSGAQYELANGMEQSSAVSNNEEDDRVSVSLGNDGELDESESKRRRMETYAREVCGATRAIREPRVVVQTTSEVDILDDGYRWRKYGQKVVKGNPNPRSYYKCTSPGCNVRKHVERASHDLKSVITTYEGKHNHEVPTAKNNGNSNSRVPNTPPVQQAADSGPISGRPAWLERLPLTSFGLLGPGFGFGVNQPNPVSLGLASLRSHHLYARNQPRLAYMMPKEEPVMDSGLNSAVKSSPYQQQLMNRVPLGPHI